MLGMGSSGVSFPDSHTHRHHLAQNPHWGCVEVSGRHGRLAYVCVALWARTGSATGSPVLLHTQTVDLGSLVWISARDAAPSLASLPSYALLFSFPDGTHYVPRLHGRRLHLRPSSVCHFPTYF
jgi:hypothetical protein